MIKERRIFKDRTSNREELGQLLETVFLTEIMYPSSELLMVFPWISDVQIVDNRSGAFIQLMPHWGKTQLRLSDILVELLKKGTILRIATRKDTPQTERFIDTLTFKVSNLKTLGQIFLYYDDELHIKGLLGDNYYLKGSMNLTYNGIEILREEIEFTLEEDKIAEARIHHNKYIENLEWEKLC